MLLKAKRFPRIKNEKCFEMSVKLKFQTHFCFDCVTCYSSLSKNESSMECINPYKYKEFYTLCFHLCTEGNLKRQKPIRRYKHLSKRIGCELFFESLLKILGILLTCRFCGLFVLLSCNLLGKFVENLGIIEQKPRCNRQMH